MVLDADLQAIQDVRNLVQAAKAAQKQLAGLGRERIDAIVEAVASRCVGSAEPLARMAVEETGFGRYEDKVQKNLLASKTTCAYIRGMKAVGVISEDREKGLMEVGVPMGVIAAIIPSTNPTSTVMYKALISLKGGNAVVFSPHPGARKCILETVRVIREALTEANAPEGLVGCIERPTLAASQALMKHRDIGMILATGGEGIVRAAYSSGNPAIGVGPGNGPAYIERTADVAAAVRDIFQSKTFDNGTICASEQSIVTERCIDARVREEVRRQGGYFLNGEESERLACILLRANGSMNPAIVGKSAVQVATLAGIRPPEGTRVLLSEQKEVSKSNPYAREKLCPVLGYFVEETWEEACERCIAILENEGLGHTMVIHSNNREVIDEFALHKPVSRLLVNTPGALGGVGATTNLPPAFTLGCGAIGKSATSDNITPMHLINIRRVAWGARSLEEQPAKPWEEGVGPSVRTMQADEREVTAEQVEAITRAVLARLIG